MNLFKVLQARSRAFFFLLAFLSIISSLTNIGILLMINMALGGKKITFLGGNNYIVFIALIVLSFVCTALFQNYMAKLTNDIMYNMELSIVQKVRNAAFESFEKIGIDKIYSAISDARVLSRVPEILVTLLNSIITLTCSIAYLFWVSFYGGITVVVLMALLLLIYLYRNGKIEKDLNKVRDLQDTYYALLRELLIGFRQIRISTLRNNNIFNKHILFNRDKARALSLRSSRRYIANELTGVYSWYLVLGIVIFLLPTVFHINLVQLAAFITTVLFMMSPVSQLIMVLPFYTMFKISIGRIDDIDKKLQVDAIAVSTDPVPVLEFNTIRFENIVYKYANSDNTAFELWLTDFTISREEILFVIGGNGSGKTTFINLFTGLIKPISGKIMIDEREVSWETFTRFSNSMSVVYTNQYLFRQNYDDHNFSEESEQLQHLRQMLNLDGVLRMNPAKTQFDTALSKGQQKRVSLLLALLENKPIIILDEWAAEQDPHNRRSFYTMWIETMRKMGKTVIAVSHDDDYYHVGDRVVKFDYGKVVSVTSNVHVDV